MGSSDSAVSNPHPDTSGLKPWQPGQSGNPAGSSRKQYISRFLLARSDADWAKLEKRLWGMAVQGNLAAIQAIYDRVEGKVPLPTTVEGGLIIEVRRADRQP